MAFTEHRGTCPVAAIRGCEFRVLPERTRRSGRVEAARYALRRTGRFSAGRGIGPGICEALLSSRGEAESGENGSQHTLGDGRHHRGTRLDDSGHEEEGARKDGDLPGEGRLSRQVEGLLVGK